MAEVDPGQMDCCSLVCGGVARLPQSSTSASILLTMELEVDPSTRSVLAVHVNPELNGLKHILEATVVGRPAANIPSAGVQAIADWYYSPFRNAARAALLHAWDAFCQFEKKLSAASAARWAERNAD